jgi:hypothetical protein
MTIIEISTIESNKMNFGNCEISIYSVITNHIITKGGEENSKEKLF